MSKLKKLHNRVLVFAVFLLTFTRLTVARILPSARTDRNPSPKVFALTEAAWAELRAGVDLAYDDQVTSKRDDEKKDTPKGDEKDTSKSDDKKDGSKGDDKKDSSKGDDKKDAGTGGGDGDVAEGVGG